jgi:hypothetical protein
MFYANRLFVAVNPFGGEPPRATMREEPGRVQTAAVDTRGRLAAGASPARTGRIPVRPTAR